jgi:hypothetical protein
MHPRATVDRVLYLSQQGLIDRVVAQRVGVSIGAVQKWRTGIRRASGTAKSDCPRFDGDQLDEPGYSDLLGLYLGDGCISREAPASRTYGSSPSPARMLGPGLIQECARAIRAVTPGDKVLLVQRVGCTEVKSYSRHWPCLFPQHGPGKKRLCKIDR